MVDSKDVASNPSTPATPGTPGAPLFGGNNVDKSVNGGRPALNNCSCFGVNAWAMEEGSMRTTTCTFTSPAISLARKVGAEFVGTLIFIFAGAATGIVNQKTQGSLTILGLAASGGLAVMIVTLSTGHISGAHLNPSVTIAFAALRHFPWKQVPMYIGAQVMASICAAFALKGIFHPFMGGGVTVPTGSYGQAFALEFIISFNLMFVITAVATDTRAVGELAGIAVGATIMLNVLIAGYKNSGAMPLVWLKKLKYSERVSALSNEVIKLKEMCNFIFTPSQGLKHIIMLTYSENSGASMNPVRTLGPAIAANNFQAIWVYLTAPILGALCGAGAYSAVKLPEVETQERPSIRSLRR